MGDEKKALRLTESFPGRVAGWLLAVLWVFSMSGVDAHAFSSYPACVALVGVLALAAWGLLRGARLVRISWLGWCSLLAGGYFLVRCLCSYAVVDSWCEAVLILGAFVYYVAGVYAAQLPRHGVLFAVLGGALLANVVAYCLVDIPGFELAWTGRASQTPAGPNSVPTTLFVYKNFAGVFLCLGGCALGAWSLWRQAGVWRVMGVLVSVVSVALSFACDSRSVYMLLPLALLGGWLMSLLLRVCSGRRLGWWNALLGVLLLVAGGLVLYDFLFGNQVVSAIFGVNSHLRYLIWRSVCEVLPGVPWYGCGANVTQWEIVPWYNEWQLPNYAHNEYLQVWVDYGLFGLVLVLGVLLLHVLQGLRCMVSDYERSDRRLLAGLAALMLLLMAVYAVVDFPWHSFALVALCAFLCGVLASPFVRGSESVFGRRRWAAGSHAAVLQVRAERWPGRVVLLVVMSGLGVLAGWLAVTLRPAWKAQWEYETLCCPGVDDSGDARRALIAGLVPLYPSPALMDTYFMLPPPLQPNLALREQLLKTALAANPRQLFTLTMLVDVLGSEQKFAEADRLMREYYVGDSMPDSCLNDWPSYYGYNLLIWGRYEMQQGNHARALSLLTYALALDKATHLNFTLTWRKGPQPWNEYGGIKPGLRRFVKDCEVDVRMLRAIGVQPDDSWRQAYTPGGKPALYGELLRKKQK